MNVLYSYVYVRTHICAVEDLCYGSTTKNLTNLVYQFGFGECGKLYTMQNPVKKYMNNTECSIQIILMCRALPML